MVMPGYGDPMPQASAAPGPSPDALQVLSQNDPSVLAGLARMIQQLGQEQPSQDASAQPVQSPESQPADMAIGIEHRDLQDLLDAAQTGDTIGVGDWVKKHRNEPDVLQAGLAALGNDPNIPDTMEVDVPEVSMEAFKKAIATEATSVVFTDKDMSAKTLFKQLQGDGVVPEDADYETWKANLRGADANGRIPKNTIVGVPLNMYGGKYKVHEGDTLETIAASQGITVEALMQANGITDPKEFVATDDELVIPPKGATPDQMQMSPGQRAVMEATAGEPSDVMAATAGEQTQPGTAPGAATVTPQTDEARLLDIYNNQLSPSQFMAMLMPKETDAYTRAQTQAQAPLLEMYAPILNAANGLSDVQDPTMVSYYQQAAQGNMPSTQSVLDALYQLPSMTGDTAAQSLLGNEQGDGGMLDTIRALLGQRMGNTLSQRLLSPSAINSLMAELASQRDQGANYDLVSFLREKGVL